MIKSIEVMVHKMFATEKELIEYGYEILAAEGDWFICVIK